MRVSFGTIYFKPVCSATVVLDPTVLLKCGSPGSRQGQFGENALRSVTSAFDDDIVAADCSRIQVFSNKGKFLKELGPKLGK